LPILDGWQVMSQLQADPETASIPVHFISAVDAAERGKAMGAVGYLVKPATRGDLIEMVEALARPNAKRGSRRILIVEDDADVAASLDQLLTSEQLQTCGVTGARAALAALERERFACMILDLSLPDMDGLDLLAQVQARAVGDVPPVIVYTAR